MMPVPLPVWLAALIIVLLLIVVAIVVTVIGEHLEHNAVVSRAMTMRASGIYWLVNVIGLTIVSAVSVLLQRRESMEVLTHEFLYVEVLGVIASIIFASIYLSALMKKVSHQSHHT